MRAIDDDIARALQEAIDSGELAGAAGFGKPIPELDAYRETPEEFRLAFKMLKDSGFVPPEVAALREVGVLQARHDALDPADPERRALADRIQDLRLRVAMRLESMRATGSL